MKKALAFMMLGLFVISMIGMASAKTIVAGKITDDGILVEGADVNVKCYDGDILIGEINTNSIIDGSYMVEFYESTSGEENCDTGNEVTVIATTEEGYGAETGIVMDKGSYPGVDINLAIINVTVPEFGFVIGLMTLLASVGIFFIVRRE